jgi:uncharacterized membrane protein
VNRAWRYVAAGFWIASGANHFRRPRFYKSTVPPPLDRWQQEVNLPKFKPALLWARLPVQGLFAWLTWRGSGY